MKRIFFHTPFFWRSGSEIVLLNLINQLDNTKYEIAVSSNYNGELFKVLPPHIKSFNFENYLNNNSSIILRTYNFIYSKLYQPLKIKYLDYIHKEFSADLWYINTIVQTDILEYAINNKIPCIVHSHEMEQVLAYLTKNQIENLINYPRLIIACSQASANTIRVLGRTHDLIVFYPLIDTDNVIIDESNSINLRNTLGISKETFIWGMSGNLDNNKNPSLFVEILFKLLQININVYFIWIGGNLNCGEAVYAQKKAEYLGVSDHITWTGALTNNYYDYLNMINGFVLTSTKDSFPLVMIESSYLCKPIVGFNSGGLNEFIGDLKIGKVIDNYNVDDLVQIMIQYTRQELEYDCNAAKNRALQFSLHKSYPKFNYIIQKVFEN